MLLIREVFHCKPGKVRPLGQAQLGPNKGGLSYAVRQLTLKTGQALRVYSKVEGVSTMTTPYSNDVDFKVK